MFQARKPRPKPIKLPKKESLAERLGLKYTVMLVPHSEKKPIHLKLPVGVFLVLLVFSLGILSATCYFAYSAWRLQAVAAENTGLKKITADQEIKLEQLETLADQVLLAARSAGELENDVRESIGLDPEESLLPAYGGPYEEYRHASFAAGDAELTARIERVYRELTALDTFYGDYAASLVNLEDAIENELLAQAYFPDQWPIENGWNHITSGFGVRVDPFNYSLSTHNALDISSEKGTPIYAAGRGVVTAYESDSGYGLHIVIDHGNGYQTLYAHCSELLVPTGTVVNKGDVIALVGSTGRATGNHLHFGMLYNGTFIDPYNVLS